MCNHYQNNVKAISSWSEYISWGLAPLTDDMDAAENVYPKKQGLVIRNEGSTKIAEAMHWGFPWIGKGKRPRTTKKMNTTNVRNLKSPLFRNAITSGHNRCLVPFTRFAEPKPGGGRQEVWFSVNENEVACFAGIWRKQEEGNCYAFLTCEPNALVKPIHPKAMPVILDPKDYEAWLSGEDAATFQEPFPSQLMSIVDN